MIVNILGFACCKLKKHCKAVSIKTLNYMNTPNVELSIKFVSPAEIKRLNAEFRQIDRVTDVLSFPATNTKVGQSVEGGEGTYLGDMAICLKQAKTQAKQYGTTYFAEVQKLVVHSILHLLGYDHIADSDYTIMNAKEEEIAHHLAKGE